MFDSFILEAKCPVCDKNHRWEFQTKELSCSLAIYSIGDFVSDKFNYVDAYGECVEHDEIYDAKIMLDNGHVSGVVKFT